jgi:hypothetical protein
MDLNSPTYTTHVAGITGMNTTPHQKNHFSYEDKLHFLKMKWYPRQTALHILPPYLPVPVVSGSGHISVKVRKWNGKRRTTDAQLKKDLLQVECIDPPLSW